MHVHIYVSMYMYACIYACMHACFYVCMHACMHVCIGCKGVYARHHAAVCRLRHWWMCAQRNSMMAYTSVQHSLCVHARCVHSRCVHSRCVHLRCVHSRCVHSRCVHSRCVHSHCVTWQRHKTRPLHDVSVTSGNSNAIWGTPKPILTNTHRIRLQILQIPYLSASRNQRMPMWKCDRNGNGHGHRKICFGTENARHFSACVTYIVTSLLFSNEKYQIKCPTAPLKNVWPFSAHLLPFAMLLLGHSFLQQTARFVFIHKD